MSKINLYRIDEGNHRAFLNYLEEKLVYIENKELEDEEEEKYSFSLFKINEEVDKEISWNWILNEFGQPLLSVKTQPKAVLVIEYDDEMYAVTFGSAFFLVDKYCDRNFAFEFARRMKYLEIKTTTLLSPNMQRNKNISTYINYESLEFDSGESFAKLKAKLNLDEYNNALIGETVEFGNSIKFDLKVSNLENVSRLITFIKLILNQDEIYKIPVFNNVTDKDLLEQLETNLFSKIEENINDITISELDIIGVSEIFNNQDTFFELWHGHKRKEIESLNLAEVEKFAEEKEIELSKEILNIKVKSFNNGKSIRTDKIKNLIDYVDDDKRCVLNKGIWYHYNDDYQKYLEDSISEIEVIYSQEYDFSDSIHQDFIDEKFNEEKEDPEFEGLTDSKVKEKLKNKYYAERAFNLLRVRDGFENYDRVTNSYAGAQIELMDLYKGETMYAVKIGSASSTLCYAVDQSISSLKMYKHNTLEGMPAVKNVAVWLVLKRQPLSLNQSGQPNLNTLNMIMLKNKLDSWKKEVRLQGLNPIVYINYKQ
ncbi:TIGR04141 family sporadically distributed protein [Caldibacillus lycopersici]|uniref:TIGR04141 family sporadically distributed protein n=1 Tax=Perspicuibacillus lycopersici TaxID=1325689 RepID=A0AAE3LNW5_9BACI|nr:DUF6119 family protein [Perspicuibacillus lycopersici]MCU9614351.1 TIGR04141 family sporadically distributed protein [Perspicuibacillus lycopersici]